MIYQKNLEVLNKTNISLAEKIKEEKEQDWMQVIDSKNGKKNLLIKKGMKTTLVYPEKNPLSLSKEIAKADILHKDTVTIVIGMGLGHLLHSLLKKKHKEHKIILIEPIIQLIQESFSIYDFTEWIEDGSLYIVSQKEEIDYTVYALDSVFVIQNWIVIGETYITSCEEYSDISSYAIEIINKMRCNTGTIMGAGKIIAENDIKNLPYVIRHRGINELKDIFKNKPAVLVSTGPSLQKNIHLLKDIQDKVVIIAVAQALRVLLAYDIVPDFIGTVDYGEVNLEHFKGLMDSNVPLVALNRTYAPILKQWQGTKFIVSSTVEESNDSIQNFIGKEKGSIPQGGSVSHFIFSTAVHLGCDPIILLGLDLSYPNKVDSHIKLADARGKIKIEKDGMIKWDIDDPRSLLKKEEHLMGNQVFVSGYFDEDVITNMGLASFITSFEAMFEQNKDKKIIDSTEGGAKKKGAERITLQKVIDKELKDETIDKTIIKNFSSFCDNSDELIQEAIVIMEKDIGILDDVIDNSKKGIETCDKLFNIIEQEKNTSKYLRNKELKTLLKENEEYSNAAHTAAKQNNLVAVSIYDINRKIYSKELFVDGKVQHLLKDEDDLKIRVERNQMILSAAKEAGEKLKPLYEDTIDILQKYIDTKDKSILVSHTTEDINLDDAEDYLQVGNWAHPLIDAKKILNEEIKSFESFDIRQMATKIIATAERMKRTAIREAEQLYIVENRQTLLDYNKLIEEAKEIGRDEKDFGKALSKLKEANQLDSTKLDAAWGLATVYHHIGEIDKSLEYYENLINNFPNSNRFKFEYAQVLLQKDFEKGMDKLKEIMERTNEFDYFYCKIGDLYKNKNPPKAIFNYKKYLKTNKYDYTIWSRLKECYLMLGKNKEADIITKKLEKL